MEGEGMRPPEPEPEVSENGEPVPLEPGEGVLELHPNGYDFFEVLTTIIHASEQTLLFRPQ
jgi:hypothetical protein